MPLNDTETRVGRITAWDPSKGYGFLQAGGDQRVFLHIRDFAERHKAPEVGDVIIFTLGADQHGRRCAKGAWHRHDGGRWRPSHFVTVLLLLTLPASAVWSFAGQTGLAYASGGYMALSLFTYWAYASDKRSARAGEWRTSEATLHLMELVGGWPGAFLAQRRLRHKCSKLSYQVVFWLIVGLHQYVALDFLLDWRIGTVVQEFVRGL